jgi:hypothetical protein
MMRIVIRQDHVVVDDKIIKVSSPSIDGLSLSEIADITLRCLKYRDYLLRAQKIRISQTGDHEGTPLEDDYHINFEAADCHTSMWVHFHSEYESVIFHDECVNYDYVAKVNYKDVKFKIYSASLDRGCRGNTEAWFRDELTRLKKILDDLDQATLTLRSWADSGLSMRAHWRGNCNSCSWSSIFTRRSSIISGHKLRLYASRGLSLDDFKQKLRCKACGDRCSGVSVP